MAGKKKYESKAVTVTIKFTSRASITVDGKWYTIECTEERIIPDINGVDIEQERALLWDTVNDEVDAQINDIYDAYSKRKEKGKKV